MSLDRDQAARRALTIALRTAAAIMGSRDEAADVAQDVTVDVLRSLDRLRDPQAFDAWVHRITVRHTLRAVRKRRLSDRMTLPWALTCETEDVSLVDVDHDLLIGARAALAQALTTLPPRQRAALILRYVHDLTDRQIAEALGCRRGTVNALLSRARAALRQAHALEDLISAMGGSIA
jgi:RNA polymerase sigma-70 factor (ECF subfamily)